MEAVVAVVSASEVDGLSRVHEVDVVREMLLGLLEKKRGDHSPVLGDLYLSAYVFCRRRKFSAAKIATLLTLCHCALDHDRSTSDPLDTFERSYERFEEMLVAHSVERPPWTTGTFTLDDVRAIVDFMLHNYYRHYRLYKALFTKKVVPNFHQEHLFSVERPTYHAPLTTATRLEEQ